MGTHKRKMEGQIGPPCRKLSWMRHMFLSTVECSSTSVSHEFATFVKPMEDKFRLNKLPPEPWNKSINTYDMLVPKILRGRPLDIQGGGLGRI